MREKDIKIGLLSSGPSMIPICLSPGDPSASLDQKGIRLRTFPLSKRWVSLTVPLQSLPVSQEAPNNGLPLSPNQCECRNRNTTHIYEIIWHLRFRYNERKNCFSLTEMKHVTPGNGSRLLLSCLRGRLYSIARGVHDDAIKKLVGQFGKSREKRQHAVWRPKCNTDGPMS